MVSTLNALIKLCWNIYLNKPAFCVARCVYVYFLRFQVLMLSVKLGGWQWGISLFSMKTILSHRTFLHRSRVQQILCSECNHNEMTEIWIQMCSCHVPKGRIGTMLTDFIYCQKKYVSGHIPAFAPTASQSSNNQKRNWLWSCRQTWLVFVLLRNLNLLRST